MSDFVNGFWSVYVALITLVSVVGCGVLLWTQSRARTNAAGETDNERVLDAISHRGGLS